MSGFLSSLFSNSAQSNQSANSNIIGGLSETPEVIGNSTGFNTNYLVYLHGHDEQNTPVSVMASIPEQFGIHIMSDWHSILNTMSAGEVASGAISGLASRVVGAAGGIAKNLTGVTDVIPQFTHQVWSSTSPINFSVPFQFNAVESDIDEVMKPIRELVKLAAPSVIASGYAKGFLRAPGPSLIRKKSLGKSPYSINLHVGNTFTFKDVIVTGVNFIGDSMFTINGNMISAQVDVNIMTSRIYTKSDIDKVFITMGGSSSSTQGNNAGYGPNTGGTY